MVPDSRRLFKSKLLLPILSIALLLPILAVAEVTTGQQTSAGQEAAQTPTTQETQAPAPAEAAAPVGDYAAGKALFTGEKRFKNGGPPCISCHSAGVGELGGGILGPNLTKAFADPSKNPLLSTAWVNGGGSPVMGPIFSSKNITDEEMINLRAFFKAASEKEVTPASTGKFTIIGLLGSVGILVLFSIVWSARYSKRNQNTAHEALWRNYGGKGGR